MCLCTLECRRTIIAIMTSFYVTGLYRVCAQKVRRPLNLWLHAVYGNLESETRWQAMVTIHAHATTMSLTLNRRKLAACSMAACTGSKDGYPLRMRTIGNRYLHYCTSTFQRTETHPGKPSAQTRPRFYGARPSSGWRRNVGATVNT